jgi:hypothetical protein
MQSLWISMTDTTLGIISFSDAGYCVFRRNGGVKIQAIDCLFRQCGVGMRRAFEAIISREIDTTIAGNLMQSPDIVNASLCCCPATPEEKTCQKASAKTTPNDRKQLNYMIGRWIQHRENKLAKKYFSISLKQCSNDS